VASLVAIPVDAARFPPGLSAKIAAAGRRRAGLIDANGVGDVPSYYGMAELNQFAGPESATSGQMTAEVITMDTAKPTLIAAWHFLCPECGFSDAELGHHGEAHTIHCEICLEDGMTVRLKRWPVEEARARSRAA
jgi:hypothetical protein